MFFPLWTIYLDKFIFQASFIITYRPFRIILGSLLQNRRLKLLMKVISIEGLIGLGGSISNRLYRYRKVEKGEGYERRRTFLPVRRKREKTIVVGR